MEAVTRLCLTGPESTGKSWLAERLASRYGGACLPEFAREHALAKGELGFDDVEIIARGHIAAEERCHASLIILDTDLISTVAYSRHFYGRCPDWIVDAARARLADLYLLLDIDVPWEPDPARDPRSEHDRPALMEGFRAALQELGARWILIGGPYDERERQARAALEALLRGERA